MANNFYYFSLVNDYGIIKTSLTSSTVQKSYGDYGNLYRGLFYDSTASTIIAAGCNVNSVDTFDLDLNLVSTVSIPYECPHHVTVYKSRIYVVLFYSGYVAVILNGVLQNSFSTECSVLLTGVSIDPFGYFALSCWGDNKVYIYDSNMQYTNKSITHKNVMDTRLDTNNRLTMCGGANVVVYEMIAVLLSTIEYYIQWVLITPLARESSSEKINRNFNSK